MRRLLFVFLLGLVLSGCSTTWHINKARDRCPECFTQDTTITEIVVKRDTVIRIDTNIIILLPRDTAKIDTMIKKLRPYSFKPVYAKNGVINVEVSMTRGTLSVISHLDSTFIYRYRDSIRIRNAIISNLRTVTTEQNIIIQKEKKAKERFKSLLLYAKYVIVGLLLFIVVIIIMKLIKWLKK